MYAKFGAMYAIIMGASATNMSGIHAELDIAVIEQAKDVYLDTILHYLNDMDLPNITSDDGKNYLHGNHLTVAQNANNVAFGVDVAKNAITLNVNNLTANYYCDDFRGHEWIFVAYGHIHVELETIALGIGLSFET